MRGSSVNNYYISIRERELLSEIIFAIYEGSSHSLDFFGAWVVGVFGRDVRHDLVPGICVGLGRLSFPESFQGFLGSFSSEADLLEVFFLPGHQLLSTGISFLHFGLVLLFLNEYYGGEQLSETILL